MILSNMLCRRDWSGFGRRAFWEREPERFVDDALCDRLGLVLPVLGVIAFDNDVGDTVRCFARLVVTCFDCLFKIAFPAGKSAFHVPMPE